MREGGSVPESGSELLPCQGDGGERSLGGEGTQRDLVAARVGHAVPILIIKVLGELSELQIKALLSDSHWAKYLICCPVIGQETSKGPVN